MKLYCTRPGCLNAHNHFADLDDPATLSTVQQKYCTTCGMPLILGGHYLPQDLLGQGGFGTAFLAYDHHIPGMRRCVVKQFQPPANLTQTQLQCAQRLFEQEAKILAQLGSQHPQIPNLFAFFELTVPSLQPSKQDKFFYLVQEFINGRTLEEELQLKGKFSPAEVLEVLHAILPVLQFIHEHGSIHRDLKPSNIMRDRDGRLFLIDFGAVKQVTTTIGVRKTTSMAIHSPGYAPSEQISGGEVYPATDLYALAVTCLVLLTGKEPKKLFDAYTHQWNWRSHFSVEPEFAKILERMLLPTPHQRFASAQEVTAALGKLTLRAPAQPLITSPAVVSNALPSKRLSTLELLYGAAVSGFEGGLITIALNSIFSAPLALVTGLVILSGLIYAQTRRWVEKYDLIIIVVISLVIVYILPGLRNGLSITQVILIAGLAGLIAIVSAALFRLVYKLLAVLL